MWGWEREGQQLCGMQDRGQGSTGMQAVILRCCLAK